MNAVAMFRLFDYRTRLPSTRIIPAYNYATDWIEERHEQNAKNSGLDHKSPHFGPSSPPVPLQVMRHHVVGMLIAFLVQT